MKLLNINLYELASEFLRKGLYRGLLQGTTIGVSNVDIRSLGYNLNIILSRGLPTRLKAQIKAEICWRMPQRFGAYLNSPR